jgi:hypothetical protein
LRLEPAQSAELTRFIEAARRAGFVPGTPLVGVNWEWSSGVAYALGARVPDSLMLAVFGGAGTIDGVDYNLTFRFTGFPSADAWISTTRSSVLKPDAQRDVAAALQAFGRVSGRPFPSGYTCVAAEGDQLLWRPAVSTGAGAGPTSAVAVASCPSGATP